MSDKFFFKGKQQPRIDHTNRGFETKARLKIGTRKYPLNLVVTSETRKKTLASQVAKANLYANIIVDTSENAVESINELNAALNKGNTVKVENALSRNEPCSCGSGKKFKKCCAS